MLTLSQVIDCVQRGERLPRPKHCPKEMFLLMEACWREDPDERPTFADVAQQYKRWRKEFQAAESQKADRSCPGESCQAHLPMRTIIWHMPFSEFLQ